MKVKHFNITKANGTIPDWQLSSYFPMEKYYYFRKMSTQWKCLNTFKDFLSEYYYNSFKVKMLHLFPDEILWMKLCLALYMTKEGWNTGLKESIAKAKGYIYICSVITHRAHGPSITDVSVFCSSWGRSKCALPSVLALPRFFHALQTAGAMTQDIQTML